MWLIEFTPADGWRGHEQKIIYLYESFRDFGYVEEQWIVCRNDSMIKKVALEKAGVKVGKTPSETALLLRAAIK